MRTDWARLIGWAIPLICIGIAGFVIFRERSAFVAASQDQQAAQLSLSNASMAREKAEQESGAARYAAIPPSLSEEPKFLGGLRSRAAVCGVRITKWSSQTAPLAPATGDSGAPAVDPAIKSIVKIQGDLTLDGPYGGIRDFLFELGHRNRLYAFSNMRWSLKDSSSVELTTTLSRFVDPTLPAAPSGTAAKNRS